ncbi:hypothetical protein [Cellulomonas fimi]|uniref:Uncharacterized protein n=1 Tax=Cellulomonas fimi (strain ATCC 484 / DSM 20113 / JCM 1341 / CCUG 24087 / LMG 16345 / NBRC 15513 / NCIMB 8980 / NCTC 7547 / NRS-133) TaxID=590998 RepID=F4H517_CELFA|nr:hypothetical protein [Cellulomonas fimi]AEE45497.1 hypothetical protein Celf_1362 [Cellulomonas fimi ATCC 484]NNH07277.1 hypothetical protein [Cellulomonas fimi]VEH29618.1 Uncharacterised protein [Cellulomonas fimi]
MRTRTARPPAGPAYDVAVQWAPRSALVIRRMRRWHRRRNRDTPDVIEAATSLDLDDGVGILVWIAGAVAFVVGILLVWWLVVPLLLLVLDLAVVVAVLVLGLVARTLLRRPWVVAVTPADHDEPVLARADVLGWRRALGVRDAIARHLAAGAEPSGAVRAAAGTDTRVVVVTVAAPTPAAAAPDGGVGERR